MWRGRLVAARLDRSARTDTATSNVDVVSYSRPRGNTDPDIDPSTSQTITVPQLIADR